MLNMKKIYSLIAAAAFAIMWLAGCEEASRYEISGSDTTPPGMPVFIDSKPLPGGTRIYFRPPADKDVLSIEASYLNTEGKPVRFAASYFTDSLDVCGFGREGEHQIEFYAVDRSGNRSESLRETVTALEPAVVTVAKTVEVVPSFFSMLLRWVNLSFEPLYISVDISYKVKGVRTEQSVEIASYMTETQTISATKLPEGEPISVSVNVSDKYGNKVTAVEETAIELLRYEELDKTLWELPAEKTVKGGATQVDGVNLANVRDGIVDAEIPGNFFVTTQNNPWNIIIDMGQQCEISNILTHQRMSGVAGAQGNLYRGNNVLAYNLYGWDETTQAWELWMRKDIKTPVVVDSSQYLTMGLAGDMAYIYPEEPKFSKPTRWVRFEAINGKYISEITLYGRSAE